MNDNVQKLNIEIDLDLNMSNCNIYLRNFVSLLCNDIISPNDKNNIRNYIEGFIFSSSDNEFLGILNNNNTLKHVLNKDILADRMAKIIFKNDQISLFDCYMNNIFNPINDRELLLLIAAKLFGEDFFNKYRGMNLDIVADLIYNPYRRIDSLLSNINSDNIKDLFQQFLIDTLYMLDYYVYKGSLYGYIISSLDYREEKDYLKYIIPIYYIYFDENCPNKYRNEYPDIEIFFKAYDKYVIDKEKYFDLTKDAKKEIIKKYIEYKL